MKKRFTLMMMVLCFLMSIPLKMMAETVTVHYINDKGWAKVCAYVYKQFGDQIGEGWPGKVCKTFETTASGKNVATWELDLGDVAATDARIIFNCGSNVEQTDAKGFPVINNQYYNFDGVTTDPSEGGVTPPTPPTPSDENPIDNRKYSKGYYLVGNFFNFDGETINYHDAVFKFRQQQDDAKGNDVYMVQIPATLTAKAQVMSVDATGTAVAVYGPGTNSKTIDNTNPVMGEEDHTATLVFDNLVKSEDISEDGGNYWNMKSRRTEVNEGGQDGSYTIYLTIDKLKKEPSSLKIKYDDMKRVAYYLSTDEEATAMTLTSDRKNYDVQSDQGTFWAGRYQGTLYAQDGSEFYAISNAMRQIENEDYIFAEYRGQVVNTKNVLSTYPKLFLWGNGGKPLNETSNHINAKNGTFKLSNGVIGISSWEFNSNNGDNDKNSLWGNTGGQVRQQNVHKTITSLSMVGTAIPGTTADGEWIWGSDAADMEFDVSENCYKATIVTTGDNTNKPFRFVANRTQEINWFENSNDDQKEKAANYNNDGTYGIGHKASPSDPNEISYTESGLTVNSGEDYHINWNRPAGTWTVRFYIYTYTDNVGNPSYRYFYTIHKNRDLELRDFGDVVYKSETNVRNIPNKGDYRYFRTWSDNTAWKRPKNVDVFVVSKTPAETSNGGFELTNINSFNPSEEVIPANTGVILALKKDLEVPGAVFHKRKSLTTYNTLVIPLEEATNKDLVYTGENNRLIPLIEAQVVPTYNKDKGEYNYLFGFYRANKVSDNSDYKDNDFLLGFWISNGKGAFYNNSAYLPIDVATANKMNLGVSYNDFDPTTQAKKVPGVIFDFANVGGTTGINEVVNQSTKLNDGKYYTLSGQQVEKPTAGGIYIHNGRKFVVK
uniref:starch-binding protein n=1 Tax=Prevotella sp. TaxID=59823 RepID=UPI003FF12A9D